MLELFAHHGGFDLQLKVKGDLDVDQHHTVEDVGIVLGQLFDKALGTKRGILRAGYFVMPMDETLGPSRRRLLRTNFRYRGYEGSRPSRGRSANGVGARLLRRLCARRSRQRACPRTLWPLQSSQDRIVVQSLCARAARRLLARSPHGAVAAQHEGIALMIAVIDYRAGNITSVKKALDSSAGRRCCHSRSEW